MSDTRPSPDDKTAASSAARYYYLVPPAYLPLPQHVSFGPSHATPKHPQLATTYPAIYIYPNSSHHITFPLVNHTAAERAKHANSSRPACYVAIAPHSAKPVDFEESLAPKDSGLVVVARLSKSQKTAPLTSFKDIDKLREVSIQLEIWDKDELEEELVEVPVDVSTRRASGYGNANGRREEARSRVGSGRHAQMRS